MIGDQDYGSRGERLGSTLNAVRMSRDLYIAKEWARGRGDESLGRKLMRRHQE